MNTNKKVFDEGIQFLYKNLCNHIVIQAVHDYVVCAVCVWKIRIGGQKCKESVRYYLGEMDRIKKFIFSDWFDVICDADPDVVWKNTMIRAAKAVQNLEKQKKRKEIQYGSEEARQEEREDAGKSDNAHRVGSCGLA